MEETQLPVWVQMRNLSFVEVTNITWLEGSSENFRFLSEEDCRELEIRNYSLQNISCIGHAPILTEEARIRVIVLAVMTVLSLIGNLATIISLTREKRRSRSTVYTLIYQLSVSDLFVTFACLLTESIWTYTVEWKAGNVMCKIMKYLQMFSLYVSTFVLVLIGVDRFMAVRYPLRHNETHRRCGYGIAFVWLLSGILSIPQVVIFRVAKGPFVEEFYQCVTYGFYTEDWQEQLYTIFSLIFMFILPLITLLMSYTSTFITLQKNEKIFREETVTVRTSCPEFNRRRLLRKAKMKSLKISLVIVIAFVVCWTPYFTMMLIYIFLDPDEMVSQELQKGIFFFGMSNSLINPLIYGAFHLCKPTKKSSTFNLIIQRNGPRLQYHTDTRLSTRASTRASTRSTQLYRSFRQSPYPHQAIDQPATSNSVVNTWEKGVHYSFKKPSAGQKMRKESEIGGQGDLPHEGRSKGGGGQMTTNFCLGSNN